MKSVWIHEVETQGVARQDILELVFSKTNVELLVLIMDAALQRSEPHLTSMCTSTCTYSTNDSFLLSL